MAILEQIDTGTQYHLRPDSCVGASEVRCIRIEDATVSSMHALLRWRDGVWTLRDCASTNGTWIDQQRAPSGEERVVSRKTVLQFGAADAARWRLVDDGPPSAFALSDSGTVVPLPPDGTTLGDVTLTLAESGWLASRHGDHQPVLDREVIDVGGQRWELNLVEEPRHTARRSPPHLRGLSIQVHLDQGEEVASVELSCPTSGWRCSLKRRAHHDLIVAMQRARVSDAAEPEGERGWRYRDEFGRELRIDVGLVDQWIHKLRKQLKTVGISGAHDIVETRAEPTGGGSPERGTRGRVRLATAHVEVLPPGDR